MPGDCVDVFHPALLELAKTVFGAKELAGSRVDCESILLPNSPGVSAPEEASPVGTPVSGRWQGSVDPSLASL